MVEAIVTRDGRTSTTNLLYLPSAQMDAVRLAEAVRAHWPIENSLHWALDVHSEEDRARNRRGHESENLTILRKLTLNVLHNAGRDSSIRLEGGRRLIR